MNAQVPGPGLGLADPPDHAVMSAAPSRHMLPPSRARHAPSAGQMARRRFMVRWTKWALPAAALALLGTIVLWPEFDRAEDRGRVAFRRVMQVRPEALRLVSPRYQSVDELGRPYTVTAATATQAGATDVVDLDRPRADISLTDGTWLYLEADTGRYDKPHNHLDLAGRVTIFRDDGTQLVTEQAAVELSAGTASGDAPVAAQGPFGILDAEGFRLRERGAVVVFTGRARTVLEGGH